jgi:hypothetical protein
MATPIKDLTGIKVVDILPALNDGALRNLSGNKRNIRSIEHEGSTLTLKQLSEKTGIRQEILYDRIFMKGWSIGRALTQPIRRRTR